MKQEILDRLRALEANVSDMKGVSMIEDLQNIKFNTFLYDDEYIDIVGCELINNYLDENEDALSGTIDEVTDIVLSHFWSYHKAADPSETYLGQIYYRGELMTPYDEDSSDYEEWYDWFKNEADLSEIREVIGDVGEPSFINIFSSHGFPDNYYICVQDPNPENPTVFGTDHEAAFIEIENYGTLEEFLGTMQTKEEFRAQIKEYLEEIIEE